MEGQEEHIGETKAETAGDVDMEVDADTESGPWLLLRHPHNQAFEAGGGSLEQLGKLSIMGTTWQVEGGWKNTIGNAISGRW